MKQKKKLFIFAHSKSYYDAKLRKQFGVYAGKLSLTKPVYLFGAGTIGKIFIDKCRQHHISVLGFIENDKTRFAGTLEKVPIQSPDILKSLPKGSQILIASIIYEDELIKQLRRYHNINFFPFSYLSYAVPKIFDMRDYTERYNALWRNIPEVIQAQSIWADRASRDIYKTIIQFRLKYYADILREKILSKKTQYFEPSIIELSSQEVFVDGGGYTGDTIQQFLSRQPNFSEIYSFEPDARIFKKLRQYTHITNNSHIHPVNAGLFNKNKTLVFYPSIESEIETGTSSTFYSDKRFKTTINVTSIDDFFKDKKPPTFIKLDIEGSEREALLGAAHTIRNYHPKLAVCVYHKPEDLWSLPLLIKKLNPNYKLYLRHYSCEVCETVCYAV